jgi:hypothetical protein
MKSELEVLKSQVVEQKNLIKDLHDLTRNIQHPLKPIFDPTCCENVPIMG